MLTGGEIRAAGEHPIQVLSIIERIACRLTGRSRSVYPRALVTNGCLDADAGPLTWLRAYTKTRHR
jgi:hypothetical protein